MRACVLANQMSCPLFICSLSQGMASDIVKKRKEKSCVVVGEVTAASLACEGSMYWDKIWSKASAHVCSPPLREGEIDNLVEATADRSMDIVSSHHVVYNEQQRAQGQASFVTIPQGITGLEERVMVLRQNAVKPGKMTRIQFLKATSTTAAKLLNIFPPEGNIAVGSDADIVIWKPGKSRTCHGE